MRGLLSALSYFHSCLIMKTFNVTNLPLNVALVISHNFDVQYMYAH